MTTTTSPAGTSTKEVPDNLKRIGVPPTLGEYLRDLWAHRDFLVTVPLGELRAQNQNSVLGNFWHLLNPLLLAGVMYLVFGVILAARREIQYFAAFLIIGIMVFQYVSKVIQAGARTVVSNISLIQSIKFPRASLPLAVTMSETLAYGPALLTMMVLVTLTSLGATDPATGEALPTVLPSFWWLLLLPATALMSVFALGMALVTARATFHFRDVAQLLPYLLRLWMYLSGVFYSVDFVIDQAGDRGWMVWLFKANPMWQFFTMFRDALLYDRFQTGVWLGAAAWSFGFAIFGFIWFRAHEVEYSRG